MTEFYNPRQNTEEDIKLFQEIRKAVESLDNDPLHELAEKVGIEEENNKKMTPTELKESVLARVGNKNAADLNSILEEIKKIEKKYKNISET